MSTLDGKRIAVLTSQDGVEKAELAQPLHDIRDAGGEAVHLAPALEPVQTMVSDTDKDLTFDPDRAISDVDVADFDALVIPGGTVNADRLRVDTDAVSLVKTFVAAHKPVAAICHGPWVLVEAGVLSGKILTSFPSLRTDITNAGGEWLDAEVKHCDHEGWDLITSRNPGDLDAFTSTIAAVVGGKTDGAADTD